ncbi:RNA pyrophosphohydrolase [Streptomyces sp. ADI92-24]|uniref:NUDIX hydrolase n=1 Tax=unclassified Streptomyces TaxID=2593676 RepID=UPI000F4678F8|nr:MULTISPECIES: NUDIX domain-containing protein [unclassified Streptomyces]ROQ72958.1 8-oxo-dGTP pyrophosphatase MutT (NUDIX family) [Streptomyces sp. CEV 2-1]RPK35156.1 RNA pyrophosphohydrolase [Streptomyces sp. ADI92-24]
MSDQEGYCRRSARVVLVDDTDRVLLLKSHADPADPGSDHSWCTPGGGVEEGESLAEAAARELREETGLSVDVKDLGPKVAETSGYADLGWAEGMFQDNFFHHRVTSHHVDISGQEAHERAHHAGHRWWALDELAASDDTVHPLGLVELTAELIAGRIPAEPVRLPWHH